MFKINRKCTTSLDISIYMARMINKATDKFTE